MSEEQLLNMDLHETLNVSPLTTALRVIGGWIYILYEYNGAQISTCFVPEKDRQEQMYSIPDKILDELTE